MKRFYVVESKRSQGSGACPEFLILDRAYCCKVVRRYVAPGGSAVLVGKKAKVECLDLNGRLG